MPSLYHFFTDFIFHTSVTFSLDPACSGLSDILQLGYMHPIKTKNLFDEPFQLKTFAWELTRACPLKCAHCRADAQETALPDELSAEECQDIIRELKPYAPTLAILTGGEPLTRPDLLDIIRQLKKDGHRVVLATCGKTLTVESLSEMKEAGLMGLSFSIDGWDRVSHEALRQVDGAWDMIHRAVSIAKQAGVAFQINTTVHAKNYRKLEALYEHVRFLGAHKWDLFMLVPTGRAKTMRDLQFKPSAYEEALQTISTIHQRGELPMKVTCGPMYARYSEAAGHGSTACLGGKSFAFIGYNGQVQTCGFLPVSAGNTREESIRSIWENSPLFKEFRNPELYRGKCGHCDFLERCSGCRARAQSVAGHHMAPEPSCVYSPPKASAN